MQTNLSLVMFAQLMLGALFFMPSARSLPPLPPIPREFRGAWIATVANIDWPSHEGEPEAIAKEQMSAIVAKAHRLHLNALIFQVRPSADALYESKLEPWSEYLTGKQGRAPDPLWDPLQYLIEKAHAVGIQVHAWFNPYRAMSPAQKGPNSSTHVSATHPQDVYKYGDFLWMDPGSKWVRKHSLAVIEDVVKRYDVDGIHIDDYFYPYQIFDANKKLVDFPDAKTYAAYLKKGGLRPLGDWRRHNVNEFIQSVSAGIKAVKPWVLFGISPFGIYRPGIPTGIKAGVDQYADLYADPLKWLQRGWCDYITPQLYWPIHQTPQAYPKLLDWWNGVNILHRHLWPGLYTSRVTSSSDSWSPHEILNQIALNRDSAGNDPTEFHGDHPISPVEKGASGEIHFSFNVFQSDPKGLDLDLVTGPYKLSAIPPESTWLVNGPPPKIQKVTANIEKVDSGSKNVVSVKTTGSVEFIGVSVLKGGIWSDWSFTDQFRFLIPQGERIAIIAVDRLDRISDAVIVKPNSSDFQSGG